MEIDRRLIVDQPSSADEFGGHGHLRTARQLAKTIIEFKNEDRSIGLEGDWGSGKSTVVSLASQELSEENNHKYHFFTFDLWSNQTSPFRRTFLEKLIQWSQKEFSSNVPLINELEKFQNQVRDRKRVVKTNFFRKLDWFGILFILIAPLLPLAFTWLSPFSVKPTAGSPISVFGIPLWAFSILIVLILYGAFFYRAWGQSKYLKVSFIEALSRSASIFTKQQEDETTTQNIREEDPNEYEFEAVCRKIICALQKDGTRIVIVFDNIDRLPKESIKHAWADTRAVFAGDPAFPNTNENAVTAIIPYDRTHILAALNQIEENGRPPQDDLFRKTFDAIFRVSPPVASNIREVFETTLRKGLPSLKDKGNIYNVSRIFEKSTQKQERLVTPRQIIAFINEVTSLFSIWNGDIPLETIAIYQVYRDEIERNPHILQSPNSIDNVYKIICPDASLFRNLAAIAYNVDQDLAFQVLLRTPVEAALESKNTAELQDISKSDGFSNILTETIEERASSWSEEGFLVYSQVINNVASLNQDPEVEKHIRTVLLNEVQALSPRKITEAEDVMPLRAIVEYCPDGRKSEIAIELTNWLSRCFNEKEATFEDGQVWVKSLGHIITNESKSLEPFASSVLNNISLLKNAQFILGVAYDCDEIGVSFKKFKFSLSSRNLIDPLKEFTTEDPNKFSHVISELTVSNTLSDSELSQLLGVQVEQLTSNTHIDEDDDFALLVNNIVTTYGALANPKKAGEVIGSLINHGTLAWHAQRLKDTEKGVRAVASVIWLTLQYLETSPFEIGGNTNIPVFGNLLPDKQWLSQLLTSQTELSDETIKLMAKHVIKQNQITKWIELASEDTEYQSLLRSVVKHVLITSNLPVIPFESLAAHYDFLRGIDNTEMDSILRKTGEKVDEKTLENVDLKSLPLELLKDTVNLSENGWKLVHESLENELKHVPDDEWESQIRSNGPLLKILQNQASERNFQLPANRFREPFQQWFLRLLAGNEKNTGLSETLLQIIKPATRKAIPKAIADALCNLTVTKTGFAKAISSFPDLISQIFSESLEEQKIRNFVVPAIANDTENSITFVENRVHDVAKAGEKISDELRQQLHELLESVRNGEFRDRIEALATTLGIKLDDQIKDQSDQNIEE